LSAFPFSFSIISSLIINGRSRTIQSILRPDIKFKDGRNNSFSSHDPGGFCVITYLIRHRHFKMAITRRSARAVELKTLFFGPGIQNSELRRGEWKKIKKQALIDQGLLIRLMRWIKA
jgi:hypothetical protein